MPWRHCRPWRFGGNTVQPARFGIHRYGDVSAMYFENLHIFCGFMGAAWMSGTLYHQADESAREARIEPSKFPEISADSIQDRMILERRESE